MLRGVTGLAMTAAMGLSASVATGGAYHIDTVTANRIVLKAGMMTILTQHVAGWHGQLVIVNKRGMRWVNAQDTGTWAVGIERRTPGTETFTGEVVQHGRVVARSVPIVVKWQAAANGTSWSFGATSGPQAASLAFVPPATARQGALVEDLGAYGETHGCYSGSVVGENLATRKSLYPNWYQGVAWGVKNPQIRWAFTLPPTGVYSMQLTGYWAATCAAAHANFDQAKAYAPTFVFGAPGNRHGVAGLYRLGEWIMVRNVPPLAPVWFAEGPGTNRVRWSTVLANAAGVESIPASRVGALEILAGTALVYTNIES